MSKSLFLDPVQILRGPNQSLEKGAVLIIDNSLIAFNEEARKKAKEFSIPCKEASNQLIAPLLVDPHSILEEPINGKCENLQSLRNTASQAGYGQIAILPRGKSWRDLPEKLQPFLDSSEEICVYPLGNFSQKGEGKKLAPHAELIEHGAIGIADDNSLIEIELLRKGLMVGEMKNHPIFLAPRDKKIQGLGLIRDGAEALRVGCLSDPITSETIPLRQILELHLEHPKKSISIMNISTKEGVNILRENISKIPTSVCWWHLINDRTMLSPNEIGWKVFPSIGSPEDKHALIDGLKDGTLTAIAVNAVPLDEEEILLPADIRPAGISGHHLVLPSLWQELINKNNFSIEQLWDYLSFGPSKMIHRSPETLKLGSKRWLLFDPEKCWVNNSKLSITPKAANYPWQGKEIKGKIIYCGVSI